MVTTAEHPLSLPPIDQNMRVQKIFNGYLRITNENFVDAYENSNSTEFANLANKVKEAVSPVPGQGAPSLLSALAHPPSPRPKGHGSLPSQIPGGHLGRGRRSGGAVAALRPACEPCLLFPSSSCCTVGCRPWAPTTRSRW